jgi:hypothetical protein
VLPATTLPAITPAAVTPRKPGAALGANAGFTAYRASIGTIRVAKKRSSAKFTLSCPPSAPRGCLVKVSGAIAGEPAIPGVMMALPRGASTPVTVKLTKSATKRLLKKGGFVQFTAQTALSSLPASTQAVKVDRPSRAQTVKVKRSSSAQIVKVKRSIKTR